MTVETFVDELGRVRVRQVLEDRNRQVGVARVVSLAPPRVDISGLGVVPVHGRAEGLTVQLDDWVFVARVGTEDGERAVVVCKVELL